MPLQLITEKIHGYRDWLINSVDDYDKYLSEQLNAKTFVLFRGQSQEWPLLPGLGRHKLGVDLEVIERKAFDAFKENAKSSLHVVPKSDWDWLAVGQHHSLRTRLLDWSKDPHIGLFFAVTGVKLKQESMPELWIFQPDPSDVIVDLEGTRPFAGSRTKVFETKFDIPRIRAQKGVFVVFKYHSSKQSGFVRLEKNAKLRPRLERIRMSRPAAKLIGSELRDRGLTHERLFPPDVDKIAADINQNFLLPL